jgi:hypothetical protein
MPIAATEKKILEGADYKDSLGHLVYYNKKTKKVFSFEAVRVNNEDWLRKCIEEENSVEEWRFYFTAAPSEAEKKKLISELP